jgi:hypothetical protein
LQKTQRQIAPFFLITDRNIPAQAATFKLLLRVAKCV